MIQHSVCLDVCSHRNNAFLSFFKNLSVKVVVDRFDLETQTVGG